MGLEFVDFNKNIHTIEDIVRCEERIYVVQNNKTAYIYAILKNGEEVRFAYYSYEKLLENHQKIIKRQK